MKKIIYILSYGLLALSLVTTSFAGKGEKVITTEQRKKVALQLLKEYPNSAVFHVKGLICSSCALGIRLKLKRLKFVDNKQFKGKKGVMLLPKSQLALLAIKKRQVANYRAIAKSIKLSGYKLGEVFYLPKKKSNTGKKKEG